MGSRGSTTKQIRKPLPDYGHHNAEKKTHQDMVFEMAPEIVSDDDSMGVVNGKKVKRKRGKITTGKLGIDLERTMVIHDEKNPNIWKTEVDPDDIEAARKFAAPERENLKRNVRSALDSPRSSPDPATNISHRVDSRYTEDISPRVSLSSQHHASKTTQMSGSAGYSVARVTETRKRMEIRGLN